MSRKATTGICQTRDQLDTLVLELERHGLQKRDIANLAGVSLTVVYAILNDDPAKYTKVA